MQAMHLIAVKYIADTNTLPSRVKLTSGRFDQSVTISYDHAISGICNMALPWLEARGFDIIGIAETTEGYALLSDTFKPLKD